MVKSVYDDDGDNNDDGEILLSIDYESIKERILDTYDLEGILDILGILDDLELLLEYDISREGVLDANQDKVISKLEDFNILGDTDYYG
jgi:hypothetical protein